MVVTFGHSKRKPPKADRTYDARELSHWMDAPEAKDMIEKVCSEYQKGQTVAIGCEQGQHRSVELGERIAKRLGVKVQHLDKPVKKAKPNRYDY